MLDQSLFELAIATCFSSPNLAAKLKKHLMQSDAQDIMQKDHFHAACIDSLGNDLDIDYARRFRLNDIHSALAVVWPSNVFTDDSGLSSLDHLFESLMETNGDYYQYRDGQEQAYARICARLDPALIVCWKIAQRINTTPSLDSHDVLRIVECQQPFFSPLPPSGSGVADNHVHLGGVHYDGLILMIGALDNSYSPAQEKLDYDRECLQNLQRLAIGLLTKGTWLDTPSDVPQDHQKTEESLCILLRTALGEGWKVSTPVYLHWQTLLGQATQANPRDPRWIRQQIARNILNSNIAKAWHWFLIWLWTHYQAKKCPHNLRMAIFYLLNSLMTLRRKLIMDGQGLTRFVGFYDRPLRYGREYSNGINAANTLFQHADDVAELKVTQGKFEPKAIGKWLAQLAAFSGIPTPDGLMPMKEKSATNYRAVMDRWHYCVHFLRIAKYKNNPGLVWQEAKALHTKLHQQAGWDRPEMLGISSRNKGSEHPQLVPSRWVRGLDVAGDENLVKVETYAPAIRWLRLGMQRKPFGEPASSGLHLSVHAGEDYGHPLSGMRHLDETVQFCEMQAGDRLGHALAIGITPFDWLERHGDMVIPVDEHVDNLVWAWHYAGVMSEYLPLAAQVMPMLERRIRLMLPSVPWAHLGCIGVYPIHQASTFIKTCTSAESIANLHPDVLFKAWQLRRNCSYYLKEWDKSGVKDEPVLAALPDLEKLTQRCESNARHFEHNSVSEYKQELEYLPEVKLFRNRAWWLEMQKEDKSAPSLNCRQKHGALPKVRVRLEAHERVDAGWQKKIPNTMGLLEDTHSPQELEFMHALQDWLLDNYDQKGLIIEVNPTSNTYIAKLKKHAEHPIFRWYPISQNSLEEGKQHNKFGLRRGPIKVCINTDDPGIMPTTLRTEFALLRNAALEHKATRTDAEAWLERIRQIGLREFHQKHQSVWIKK
ncbi:antiviral RADAR system adenosine deaminase RdrB [Undibacterium sp.]|uniref:antiviral RADAR system adenosine deaminase RdrB n=1 Tax=Undibacterium sp. TaxID=1914977 RepID=UPI00272EF380|nr:antiviral RADAR system adenosine deaminase RdrB [Undibacterium sp.]MDP1977620.1 antiviral RADAR system adenosine deaminase RdrB [Undibacterium sp.]